MSYRRINTLLTLMVGTALFGTGCKDRERERALEAVDSMAAARARGETDLSNPEMGAKVLVTLKDTIMEQSHADFPRGQITVVVQNQSAQTRTLDINGLGGHWKSTPIQPLGFVLMSMIAQAGTYDLVSAPSDSASAAKVLKGKLVAM